MIVVYHDVGGSHSTATATHIYVNKLPINRIPQGKYLLTIPTFDKIEKSHAGI